MRTKYSEYIPHLIELANRSEIIHKHAAMIVMGGQPLLFTINTRHGAASKHAEENAINRLLAMKPTWRRRVHMVVIRNTASGLGVANSHPCHHCTRLIRQCPFISRVYYSRGN